MNNLKKLGTLLVFSFLTFFSGNSQSLLEIELGVNNVPITEVQFEYNGGTVTQTSGVFTNTVAVDRANVNYMKIFDGVTQTILYPNNYGSIVVNNNFSSNVSGVGVHSDNVFIPANNPITWEPAMEQVVNSTDLMEFLYYDGTSNLPGGDDFDILFAKGLQSDDYVVVGERNGNTYFTVTPLGADGNPITSARKLRYGFVNGTNSGNGTNKYDWDIGLAPSNQAAQTMVYTVVDAALFDTGGLPVYGFRIDNNGEADVKFFGLSENSFENNPNNPLVGGLEGNVFDDGNGLVNNTVDGTGISTPSSAQLHATLYADGTNTVLATMPINTDGSYEFLNLDNDDYSVLISTTAGVVGNSIPSVSLPAGWENTGENTGAGAGNDGTINGIISGITVANALVTENNFGINDTPDASGHQSVISDPTIGSYLTVGAGAAPDLTGSDTEDGVYGTGDDFQITALPVNGSQLYYNGTAITLGDDGLTAPSASNPFTINNYNPSLLQFRFGDPNATDIEFSYRTIDAGNLTSPVVDYTHTFSQVLSGSIAGNVFNDADGLTDNTVDGATINTPDATQLYATLYDSGTNTTIASIPVAADGSFEFLNLEPNANYSIVISTNQGTAGNNPPGTSLPTDWIYTGDNVGTTAGNDGNANGIQTGLAVNNDDIVEVNFGIEKQPDADDHTHTIAAPELNSTAVIGAGATNDLSGSDDEDGVLGTGETFGITSLPTNGNELYYDGTQITLGDDGINPPSAANPFTIATYDPALLEIGFTGTGTTTSFDYITIDAANEESPESTYTLNYPSILTAEISGNVFNDADGLVDNTVDGTAINTPDASQLYASLIDSATDEVLASMAVAGDGSFGFTNLTPNSDYDVIISTNQGVVGNAAPSTSLPTDWVYTGDNVGTGAGNDGTVDGIQSDISVTTGLTPNVNFGIEKLPTADDYTYTIPNPILNSFMTIGIGAKSSLTGNDDEDGVFDDGEKFGITSLPTNGNELYYDGALIEFGADGINPPSPSNPFEIAVYDPALLRIRFTGNGSTTTSFDYVTIDAAGNIPSSPATYTMNYSEVVSGSLSGTVFNDADGLTDNTVDGTGIDDPETTQLYATLYNATSDEVVASIPVDTDGTFLFENLTPNPNYGVVISTTQGVVGNAQPAAALPADWINTGEFLGTGVGNDGTTNGIQTGLTVGTTLLPNVNFGIEKTPEADSHTHALGSVALDSVWNVGTATTNTLSATDEEDGALNANEKFGITSLPTNGNELYYNDVLIEFGADGINPPSVSNPFIIASYDPALLDIKFTGVNSTTSSFDYIAFDAADEESPEATYTVTYDEILVFNLSGNVFNDADGLVNNTVDGSGIADPETTQLYAILYDNNISTVLDTFPIANDGSFEFNSLPAYSDYGVLISTTNGVIGNVIPQITLPADWMFTGDNLGTGNGSDGTPDGDQFGLIINNASVTNVNFGVQKMPEADDYSFGIANPTPDSYFTIGSAGTDDLSGNDNEDGVLGAADGFGITSLPTSGNEIYYNGSQITVGEDGINPPSSSNPFVISNYDPSLLEIRFTGGPQSSTQFNYVTIDAANARSSEATYELTYNALPVEWAAFEVEKIETSGKIYFATASESNSSHFFVQKSLDGENFRTIHTIQAQGTTTAYTEYGFIDKVLNLGINYYRIAQVDFDGTTDYTEVKSITFSADHTTLVYPNPVQVGSSVNVKYYSGDEDVQVVVSDMLGHEVIKRVISNQAGWSESNFDVSDLPAGIYALRVGNRQQAVIFTIAE